MNKRLKNSNLGNIQINDSFWNKYIDLVDDVILPTQWNLINDNVEGATKSYCMQNFRVACGCQEGEHQGTIFQDTDIAKWLEAVSYSLSKKENRKLEALADKAIDLIAEAQREDGYLNTYYTITGNPRWSNLFEGHELYIAGHMIEAAVAYYNATGKRKFMDIVCRFADYMCEVFGREEGKNHGYPGHPEVELALVKLYGVTKEEKYLALANFFVRERGKEPCYFLNENCIKNGEYIFPEFGDFGLDYTQAHLPIDKQMKAEGHAVRAVYLYSAMADLAGEYQDETLLKQCDTLWNSIVEQRMYITGSIGSAAYGERFTTDYDLPNNTNYSESCATIGLAMFSNRMFQLTWDGKYADIVEKALYNTLLAGLAMDGKHFFYVNPLEVVPEIAENNPTMRHIKTTRQRWFGTACCPPNIARTLGSLGNYIYAINENTVYISQFVGSQMEAELETGKVTLKLQSEYPVHGDVKITVTPKESRQRFALAVRKPAFSEQVSVKMNQEELEYKLDKGYLYIDRCWTKGDEITVSLEVPFRFVRCNPRVRDNIGKVCLMKGPWVYCLEEADNGSYLSSIKIDTQSPIQENFDVSLLGGTMCAVMKGKRIDYSQVPEGLYRAEKPVYVEAALKAVPYCCWNNRGKGEMLVWVNEE